METKARLIDIRKDVKTGHINMTFSCEYAPEEEAQRLEKKDLRLRAVIWREKRSLTANAYLWKLCDLISIELYTTKEEVYELMIRRYGTYLEDEDGSPYIFTLPKEKDVSLLNMHVHRIDESPDGNHYAYAIIKGSSQYDTKEMSRLLDGVVSEAKDLGIETLPPDTVKRLEQEWEEQKAS